MVGPMENLLCQTIKDKSVQWLLWELRKINLLITTKDGDCKIEKFSTKTFFFSMQ